MNAPAVQLAVLVDDNEVDLFLQKRFIEINQFAEKISEFSSPIAALDHLGAQEKENFPDIIFLDLNMPLMNGFEFLSKFEVLPEELTAGTQIVVVTSSGNTRDHERAYQYKNVLSFITKPFNIKNLNELRDKLVEKE